MAGDRDDVDGIRPNAQRFVAREKPRARREAQDWLETAWNYSIGSVPDALGLNGADAQVRGSAVLIVWSILTSLFTGLVTAFFVGLWTITLLIGIARWSKAATFLRDRVPGPRRYTRRRGDR